MKSFGYPMLRFLLLVICVIFLYNCKSNSPGEQTKEIKIMLPDNVALEMIGIPSGSFLMGSPLAEDGHEEDESPVHTVTIDYDFYIGKYEITQAQWLSLMGSWPDSTQQPNPNEGSGADYPAYHVSWNDCQEFILALNNHITKTGQGPATFRLPSEAEWEYACRAGTQTRFSFGDSLVTAQGKHAGNYMWFRGNNDPPGTKPVGRKLPNAWGLYDMHGNVWEWCQDWYHPDYQGAPTDGSAWEVPVSIYRILHGGDWDNEAHTCRSANRNDHRGPEERSADLGFRLVRSEPVR